MLEFLRALIGEEQRATARRQLPRECGTDIVTAIDAAKSVRLRGLLMRIGMSTIIFLAASLLLGLAQKKSAPPPASRVTPSSGKGMCAALSVADFVKAGVPMSATAAQNSDDETNAYCGYNGKEGSAELDIFLPAGDTPEQAIGVERTVYGEAGGHFTPISIPGVQGVQSAQICLAVPGKKPAAGIVVRKDLAVFALYIPANPNAREQLELLAQTVLSRLSPRDRPAK